MVISKRSTEHKQQWGALVTGDFNGDGAADILWHNGATDQTVVWNMSSGMFASQGVLPSISNVSWAQLFHSAKR